MHLLYDGVLREGVPLLHLSVVEADVKVAAVASLGIAIIAEVRAVADNARPGRSRVVAVAKTVEVLEVEVVLGSW